MIILRRAGFWGGILALSLTGCPGSSGDGDTDASTEGASSGASGACEPGAEVTCACTDGSMSTQVCSADGTSFGECECGPSEDSSGGMGGTSASTSGSESSGSAEGNTTDGGTSDETTAAGCMPGTANACEGCPGAPGFQFCNDQGELSECQCCEGVHPLVEGELRYCEEGWCYCGNLEVEPPIDACFEMVVAEICCPGDIILECY